MSEPTLRAGQKGSCMFRHTQGWEIHTPYSRNHNASVFPPLLGLSQFTKHFHRPRLIHTLRKHEVEFPSVAWWGVPSSKAKICLLQENISGTRGPPGLLVASLLEASAAPGREAPETPVGRRPLKARASHHFSKPTREPCFQTWGSSAGCSQAWPRSPGTPAWSPSLSVPCALYATLSPKLFCVVTSRSSSSCTWTHPSF